MKRTVFSYWSDGFFVVAASLIANACNLIYNTYLVKAKVITIEEFGVISVIGSLLSILQIPLSAYSRGIVHETAHYLGKYKQKPLHFWKKLRVSSLKPTVLLVCGWILSIPLLSSVFQIDTYLPFILLTPVWIVAIPGAIDSGFLTGTLAFRTTAAILILEVLLKLFLTIFFIEFGYSRLFYAAIPLSSLASFFVGYFVIRRQYKNRVDRGAGRRRSVSTAFVFSSFLSKISTIIFLNVDVLLAKHYLEPSEAGTYAFLSFIGKIIYFIGVLFIQFINPLVSKRMGEGKRTAEVLFPILTASIAITVLSWITFGLFGQYTLQLLDRDGLLLQLSSHIPLYTFAMGCLALATGVISYHQATRKYYLSVISLLCSLFMIAGVLFWNNTYGEIAVVVSISGILLSICTLAAVFLDTHITVIKQNMLDALEGFSRPLKQRSEQPSILVLNWRDTKHIWAGGSEVYLHEISKRLVQRGYKVTFFCGNDNRNLRDEQIDGVEIIRRGGFFTVYIWAAVYYLFRFRGQYDMIIDCENGIPFFSVLYARIPVLLIIHHVHQKVFQKHLPFPFSSVAMILERKVMPLIYRNCQVITVSSSSKKEIVKYGFANEKRIVVIEPGIDPVENSKKPTKTPSILYLGRLKQYKQVDVIVKAFAQVITKIPACHLYIAGAGEEQKNLKKLAKQLLVSKNITFLGRVSEEKKYELYSTCWIAVQPSSIEGWGITVIEANTFGTPVIGSNVSGLKDSIKHQKTGVLVPPGNVHKFSAAIQELLQNHKKRAQYSKQAKEWSTNFSWDKNIDQVEKMYVLSKENYQRRRLKRVAVQPQGVYYDR